MIRGVRRPCWLLVLALVAAPAAGATLSPDDFAPPPDAQIDRDRQTRRFDGVTEQQLLAASVGVLQDLGFTISRSNPSLGLILGVKTREAKAPDQRMAVLMLLLLAATAAGAHGAPSGPPAPMYEDQTISVMITVQPAPGQGADSHLVRVTFHRLVRQPLLMDAGILREAELYDAFDELLSKAIFLEEHKL